MGKPAVNDLRSGLATAPTLYAAEEFPELLPLIQRRFKEVRICGGRQCLGAAGWLRADGFLELLPLIQRRLKDVRAKPDR